MLHKWLKCRGRMLWLHSEKETSLQEAPMEDTQSGKENKGKESTAIWNAHLPATS